MLMIPPGFAESSCFSCRIDFVERLDEQKLSLFDQVGLL